MPVAPKIQRHQPGDDIDLATKNGLPEVTRPSWLSRPCTVLVYRGERSSVMLQTRASNAQGFTKSTGPTPGG